MDGRSKRNPAHRLDAAGDDHVVGTGEHTLRSKMRRLLAGSAPAVDRSRWDCLGQARAEYRAAGDVAGLLAGL
jgi:hypothetical protein